MPHFWTVIFLSHTTIKNPVPLVLHRKNPLCVNVCLANLSIIKTILKICVFWGLITNSVTVHYAFDIVHALNIQHFLLQSVGGLGKVIVSNNQYFMGSAVMVSIIIAIRTFIITIITVTSIICVQTVLRYQ